jgi:dihydroorotate dehydrogenase
MAGAAAVEMGTATLRDPLAPARAVEELGALLDGLGAGDVREIIGSALPRAAGT